jgi:DNA repair protein RecO (recombination protein O)
MTAAMALLEPVDQVAQEREPNPRLYAMLVGALRALALDESPLLVPAFFWKLLSLEGHGPLLDQCAGCGTPAEESELVAFDLLEGGALCRTCRRGVSVSQEALTLLRRILGGDLGRVLGEPASPATHEVAALATRSLETHLERRLKALRTLG